jgi:hypothetical protein
MPRLPTLLAEERLPGRAPAATYDEATVTRGSAAWQKFGQTLQAQAQDTFKLARERVEKEQEVEDHVQSMVMRTKFGDELAKLDIELRNAKDFNLKTHADVLKERGQDLLERIGGEAARPGVLNRFRPAATAFLGERVIRTRYEYSTNLEKEALAANMGLRTLLRGNAVEAINEQTAQMYVDQYERETVKLVGRGLDAGQVKALTLGFQEEVHYSRGLRVAKNAPDLAPAYLTDRNPDGSYKNLPHLAPDQRTNLVDLALRVQEHKLNQARIEKDREETRTKRAEDEHYEADLAKLTKEAFDGTLTTQRLQELAASRGDGRRGGPHGWLRAHDLNFLHSILSRKVKDPPSNPDVLQEVIESITSMGTIRQPGRPAVDHNYLRQLVILHRNNPGQGLAMEDYKTWAPRLGENMRYQAGLGLAAQHYEYSEAHRGVEKVMAVPPGLLGAAADPEFVQKVRSLEGEMRMELWRRAGPGGKESAVAVLAEITPKYQAAAGILTETSKGALLQLLQLPPAATFDQVKAAARQHQDMRATAGSARYSKWVEDATRFTRLLELMQTKENLDAARKTQDDARRRQPDAPRERGPFPQLPIVP